MITKKYKKVYIQIFVLIMGLVSGIILINIVDAAGDESYGKDIAFNEESAAAIPIGIINTGALFLVGGPVGWALGIVTLAISVVSLMKETAIQPVTFSCEGWIPPYGCDNYDVCNQLGDLCTKYKCESLGDSCEYDESSRVCFDGFAGDMDPPKITINESYLTNGYEIYDENRMSVGGGAGFKIKQKNGANWIKAIDVLTFGFDTNKPSRCEISLNQSDYESADKYYIAGSSKLRESFKETMNLVNKDTFNKIFELIEQTIEVETINLYVWCTSAKGIRTPQPYMISFNLDPTEDKNAPMIMASDIADNRCVLNEGTPVRIYIKEESSVAECRWDRSKKDFEDMSNIMSCTSSQDANYRNECFATIDGIKAEGTTYYFACKDINNNSNDASGNYNLTLRTGSELRLQSISPNNVTFYGRALSVYPVTLRVQTLFGCNAGRATCSYRNNANQLSRLIEFEDTNNTDGVSTQLLDSLRDGSYEYYVECKDEAGHTVNSTINFDIDIDLNAAVIARIREEEGALKLITAFDSNCTYTNTDCTFSYKDGTIIPLTNTKEHTLSPWDKSKTYYIKCLDYGSADPADCSVIIRSTL